MSKRKSRPPPPPFHPLRYKVGIRRKPWSDLEYYPTPEDAYLSQDIT